MGKFNNVVVPVKQALPSASQRLEAWKCCKVIVTFFCVFGQLPCSLLGILKAETFHPPKKLWRICDILYASILAVFLAIFGLLMAFPFVWTQLRSLRQNDFNSDAITMGVLTGGIFMTTTFIWITWCLRSSVFLRLWIYIKVHIVFIQLF